MLIEWMLLGAQFLLVIASAVVLLWISMVAQHFSVPYVATRTKLLALITNEFDLNKASMLCDLGSGDGRVVIEAAVRFPSSRCMGLEKRLGFVLLSRIRAWIRGVSLRTEFRIGEIRSMDFGGITHIYCFLSHRMMGQLEPIFETRISPGTKVFSLGFPLPHRAPIRVVALPSDISPHYHTLYIYSY